MARVQQGRVDGDEPEDVCDYNRSHSCPQKTTNDQFFDEAQWESYRRLLFDHLAMTAPNEAGRSARE